VATTIPPGRAADAARPGASVGRATATTGPSETVDVVVVGARCAGSATAIALARAGRRVVALDVARFPADTLSTHLLWPAGLAELRALGALDRVRALGAPPLPVAYAGAGDVAVRGGYTPVDGIDHGMCVRRTGLDAALVETARDAGAEVRDGVRATDVMRDDDGRAVGVRWRDRDGGEGTVRAALVVGADGRRSTVARSVGADVPYRDAPSGRACFYAYWSDPHPEWRHVAAQWREGRELGTAFPCDGDRTLVLVQPPMTRRDAFRGDVAAAYEATVASIPGLAERLTGAERITPVRSATDIASYFRHSSGPGWALAGDAGHFKDPVTAQGIRDALRYGRLLGEAAAPALDDPAALDAAVARWERGRERDCLEVFQWTNGLARGRAMSPLEVELYRAAERDATLARAMLDVFSRSRTPSSVVGPGRALRLLARMVARPGTPRRPVLASVADELATAARDARERRRVLRPTRTRRARPRTPAGPA